MKFFSIRRPHIRQLLSRRFRHVLARGARDIESVYPGGFKKIVHVRLISKIGMIKEDHLLRKRVRQFYTIKAICLHKQHGKLDDLIEFANIQAQLDDKERNAKLQK